MHGLHRVTCLLADGDREFFRLKELSSEFYRLQSSTYAYSCRLYARKTTPGYPFEDRDSDPTMCTIFLLIVLSVISTVLRFPVMPIQRPLLPDDTAAHAFSFRHVALTTSRCKFSAVVFSKCCMKEQAIEAYSGLQ